MKKIIAIVLALSLMFCFAACGSTTTEEQGGNNNPGKVDATSKFSFTYKGVEMKLSDPAAPKLKNWASL